MNMNNGYIIIDRNCRCNSQKLVTWHTVYDYLSSSYYLNKPISCAASLRALLIFNEQPITDDAYNLAYVQGKAEQKRLNDPAIAAKVVSEFIDINNKDNEPLIHRFIERAISLVESEANEITRFTMSGNTSLDNYMPHKKEFLVEVKVTEDYPDNAVSGLRNFIHDFIVSNVLYEWSQITYPAFAKHWKDKMDEDLKQIRIASERGNYKRMERVAPHW